MKIFLCQQELYKLETRVQTLLDEQNKRELYSDFDNSFVAHPITGKIKRLTNEQAIIQGVKNRIRTMFGERLYQPNIGSNVYNSLFEPNDMFLQETVKHSIENSLQNDSRVSLRLTEVSIDDVDINIRLVVTIANNTNPIAIDVILKRVR